MGLIRSSTLTAAALAGGLLSTASARDLPEIEKRGTLRVLAVLSADETYFICNEPRGGFDWELLEAFGKLKKIQIHLVAVSGWEELIPALTRGEGDVIAGGFTASEARRRLIDFTIETFPTRSVAFTRKPTRPVQSLDELKTMRIGTLKGSFMYDDLLASGIPAQKIDDTIQTGRIPEALKSGKITAGIDGIEAALIAERKDPDLQIGFFLGKPLSLAYGVRKRDAQLLAALNEYLANVRRTATWSRLAVKYFGASAPEILKKARAE